MELVVRALRCPPHDQPRSIHARFGPAGGTIGRSNTCTLPLPSPDRFISREHLEIRCRDGKYSLKVVSRINGCSVNDGAVPPGAAVALTDGDRIQLGQYLFIAELRPELQTDNPPSAFGDAHPGNSGVPGGVPSSAAAVLASSFVPTVRMEALPDPDPAVVDSDFQDTDLSSSDDGLGPEVPFSAAAVDLSTRGVDADDVLSVLTEALGLEAGDLDAGHLVESVRNVGELLSLAVSGLCQMLEMHARSKAELRIDDGTMIAPRKNNPLEHSDSQRDALRYLVDVRQHGNKLFMSPNKAIEDAVAEVCAHEAAAMAGTRAALRASLAMLSPDAVEKRMKKSSALDSVVPALHRARLWESFVAMHGEIGKEAEHLFDQRLGQELAKAHVRVARTSRRGR